MSKRNPPVDPSLTTGINSVPPIKRTYGDGFDQVTRLAVLNRDGWICQLCGTELTSQAGRPNSGIAGHIVAHADGGRPTLDNGRAECSSCSVQGGNEIRTRDRRDRWRAMVERARRAEAEVERLSAGGPGGTGPVESADVSQTLDVDEPAKGPFSVGHPPRDGGLDSRSPSAPVALARSTPDDFVGIPWLADLLEPPDGARWPRFMSQCPPTAVGSLGADLERFAADRSGRPLSWWQRLVSARLLEHDDEMRLVHAEWLLTLARQGGKSWIARELALWRLRQEQRFGEPQTALLVSNRLMTADMIQRPARAWAAGRPGWKVRHANGSQRVAYGDNEWSLSTPSGAYGMSLCLALVDEAWSVPAEHVDDGITPTMLERESAQLGLLSTAHHLAGSLFVERRAMALSGHPLAPLLIEWSADPWRDLDDREAWRQANPRWSDRRDRFVAKALHRAMTERTADTDPLAHFRAQYLNVWPGKVATSLALPGLPLLPEGTWAELVGDAELVGPVVFAVEDVAGRNVAVAAAGRSADDLIVVEGYEIGDRSTAFEWIRLHSASRPGCSVVVGPALQHEPPLVELGLPVHVATYADTRGTLAALRQVVSRRVLRHANSPVLVDQVERCRVVEARSGLRVISSFPSELVTAASWAVAGVDRDRSGAPRVF